MNEQILKVPAHVAIILDGNGRWAKERGKKRTEGHLEGYKNLKELSKYILKKGTKVLSVFAFSTENFKRPQEEVDFLMNLFAKGFKKDAHIFNEENIRVVFSGVKENLRKDVIEAMDYLEEVTKENTLGILNICLNYGGRQEIVEATKRISTLAKENRLDIEEITEETFKNYLFQDLPDIDLLIRTSGELRVSNFMLWQLSYAEFYFAPCHFPDFNGVEYDKALLSYTKRDRRFGSLNHE